MPTDSQVAEPELVLQAAVSSLRCRALIVATGARFVHRRKDYASARIGVDDGNMSELFTDRAYPFSVIGCVHQVVEGDRSFGGSAHHRYGNLAVVKGGGGRDDVQRNAAVRPVDMRFPA